MKSIVITIATIIVLTGCGMTPEEMRKAINKCEEQNLTYIVMSNSLTNEVTQINCYPYQAR